MYFHSKKKRVQKACLLSNITFIVNSIVFFDVLILHRLPGTGFFHSYYAKIANSPSLPPVSLFLHSSVLFSFMLSFLESVNRLTSLTLSRESNEKVDGFTEFGISTLTQIWRHFYSIIIPICLFFCISLNARVLDGKTEFSQKYGYETFILEDKKPEHLYGTYWLILEVILDLLCNSFVLYRYVLVDTTGNGGNCRFENSLYLISFCSFATHTLNVMMQLLLRHQTGEDLSQIHLLSNIFLDAAILLPTIFIMVFTRQLRDEARSTFFACVDAVITPLTTLQSNQVPL